MSNILHQSYVYVILFQQLLYRDIYSLASSRALSVANISLASKSNL